ncbi:MAG: aminotransferase class I/II-fold pyridoxal phosphate-dependent enzyme, partial [Deltaproteobacteria bacterium]|nr:aminotransferase class I/II-fold pyridoxal phosphate-dependent enzyme [Deltaproteobacteria bacterium]
NGTKTATLAEVIGDVPAIAMRGISKEMPWPGARCGWIEIYNRDKDPMFSKYLDSILNSKMVEVCSTTLPQTVYPMIVTHPEYTDYLLKRVKRYEKFSNIAYECLKNVKGVLVNRTNGAFYMSVCFEEGILNTSQVLPIDNKEVKGMIEELVAPEDTALDKRFVYYLLGATGVCVVPLTSFATMINGFRITLLETDEEEFEKIFSTVAVAIESYLNS